MLDRRIFYTYSQFQLKIFHCSRTLCVQYTYSINFMGHAGSVRLLCLLVKVNKVDGGGNGHLEYGYFPRQMQSFKVSLRSITDPRNRNRIFLPQLYSQMYVNIPFLYFHYRCYFDEMNFRRAFPCLDEPEFKAKFEVSSIFYIFSCSSIFSNSCARQCFYSYLYSPLLFL
jgi:hypothetical protein